MPTISSEAILRFVDRLERERVCLHGFELRLNGEVRAEGYYAPFKKGQPHRMYAVSQSMVALAVGLLVKARRIQLNDRLAAYFGDIVTEAADLRTQRVSIRDALRLASCHSRNTYREDVDDCYADSFFFATPTHESSMRFFYETSSAQALGWLVERQMRRSLLDYLDERIFQPIGATDPKRWLTDPSGQTNAGTGLVMSLQDLGKVAQMVLDNDGAILPQEYLTMATQRQIATDSRDLPDERCGYGYGFWRWRRGWAMYGVGGQMAICSPKDRALLCTIGNTRLDRTAKQRIYNAFAEEILDKLTDACEPDPYMDRKLQRRLRRLSVLPAKHNLGLWDQARRIYEMEPNQAGLTHVVLQGYEVAFFWEDITHCFRWEKWGQNQIAWWPHTDDPAIISAGLDSEGCLHVHCQIIDDAPCGIEICVAERWEGASVLLRHSSNPRTNRYEGLFWGKRTERIEDYRSV